MLSKSSRIKRLYKNVTVDSDETGYFVALDGRALFSPGKRPVRLLGSGLADALATEWRAQQEFVELRRMGLNSLVNYAIDFVSQNRPECVEQITAYAGSDLLCYRAGAPMSLVERQALLWDPLLEWALRRHGAKLNITYGVTHIAQDAAMIALLQASFKHADDFTLAALRSAVGLCGSLVLGLALLQGRLAPDAAWSAAQLDENWQVEQWGPDAEAEANRNDGFAALLSAHQVMLLSAR